MNQFRNLETSCEAGSENKNKKEVTRRAAEQPPQTTTISL